ncbi:SDR family oxidoreductase [Pontiella sulfatireligans]|uniref:3-oxoacyl-[acyl-carrier-protein] reductase FabG n=1 Tax=Pontiella sulfatireligans TaxID=2750658 RepID=A0A6C2URR6_9BACT|nr:SDR family oxidoreductase [Pontiella sulfatireligans]VGO23030.1 3-oxoacyl-[acyl-carrier-protein] reductase FabG [Pontiella sulfatireligans]
MKKKGLITGASRGIGNAIALKLAENGYDLILTGRDVPMLGSVKDACEKRGAEVGVHTADLSDEKEITDLFKKSGAIDLLVNNAGFGIFDAIEDIKLDDWQAIQKINVEGALLCMREAMRSMKKSGGGRIINISSVVGVKGYPNQVAYGASKHALLGLTKTAIEEGRDHNIRVHAICPGGVATEMVKQARPDLTDFSAMIQPEDVADAVAYLCSLPHTITIDCIHLRRAASPQTW